MELELKFTRVGDEFQIAKDRAGTLFLSRETDAMFLLTAHLKGYRRGNIKIDINEDGSLIGISGEKQIQETVMVGWKVYKKDAEVRGFKKVFRIPDGVILDKIKANFNEDESTLTITMPKKVKGIRGTTIQEVKEEHDQLVNKEGSGNLRIDEQSCDKGEKLKAKIGEDDDDDDKIEEVNKMKDRVDDLKDEEEGETETRKEDEENQRKVDERIENKEDEEEEVVVDNENDCVEDEEERLDEGPSGGGGERCNMCIPIVAGSTLLLSFVVFVIHIIRRSKNRSSTRRD